MNAETRIVTAIEPQTIDVEIALNLIRQAALDFDDARQAYTATVVRPPGHDRIKLGMVKDRNEHDAIEAKIQTDRESAREARDKSFGRLIDELVNTISRVNEQDMFELTNQMFTILGSFDIEPRNVVARVFQRLRKNETPTTAAVCTTEITTATHRRVKEAS